MFGLSLFDSSPRYIEKTTVSDELVNLDRRQGVVWSRTSRNLATGDLMQVLLIKVTSSEYFANIHVK